MQSIQDILKPLWETLPTRQREVVMGRFGVEKFKEPLTLAALGEKFGITRERVRQIEAAGLKALGEKLTTHSTCQEIFEHGRRYLKSVGGVVIQTEFFHHQDETIQDLTENYLNLLVAAAHPFYLHPADDNFRAFYYLEPTDLKTAQTFLGQWIEFLKRNKNSALNGGYREIFKKFTKGKNVSPMYATHYVDISKKIHINPFGDAGLAEWTEVRPTTIKDRVYLVLKKKKSPLHFEAITQAVNAAGFDQKVALAPTVHNELIKDERFVLVGRGMYALLEHGYQPGTAREVIQRTLKKHGALKPREIITAVQKERLFKPNTILVNLQNKKIFKRLSDGRYHIQEA